MFQWRRPAGYCLIALCCSCFGALALLVFPSVEASELEQSTEESNLQTTATIWDGDGVPDTNERVPVTNELLPATNNHVRILPLEKAAAVLKNHKKGFRRAAPFLLGLGAVLLWVAWKQRKPRELTWLPMLEALQPDAQRLADVIGSDEAQKYFQSYFNTMTAAKEKYKGLKDLQFELEMGKKKPGKELKEAEKIRKGKEKRKRELIREIKAFAHESVRSLTSLHHVCRKTANILTKTTPLSTFMWTAVKDFVQEATDEDYVCACNAALRSAYIEYTLKGEDIQRVRNRLFYFPVFAKAKQDWIMKLAVIHLLEMKHLKEDANSAAGLWVSVHAAMSEALTGISRQSLSSDLQRLKWRWQLIAPPAFLAKAAGITATETEEAKFLMNLLDADKSVQSQLKELSTLLSDIDSAKDAVAVIGIMQKVSDLVTSLDEMMDANMDQMKGLDHILDSTSSKETIQHFAKQAEEAYKDVEHSVFVRPEQMAAEMAKSREHLRSRLPLSTTELLGEKVAGELRHEMENIFSYLSRLHVDSQKLLGEVAKTDSVEAAMRWAVEALFVAEKASYALKMARVVEYKFILLNVLDLNIAESMDLAFTAQQLTFSDAHAEYAKPVLRLYKAAILKAAETEDIGSLAEAAALIRTHAWTLSHLVLMDRSAEARVLDNYPKALRSYKLDLSDEKHDVSHEHK